MLLGKGKGEVTGDKDSYTPVYTHVLGDGVTGDKDSYAPACC